MTDARVAVIVPAASGSALTQVAALSALRAEVCQQLDEAVVTARAAGASWSEVGRAAGMTRQSAHERWASCTVHLTASSESAQHD